MLKEVTLTQEEIEYLSVLVESHLETLTKKSNKMPPLSKSSALYTVGRIQDALETAELF